MGASCRKAHSPLLQSKKTDVSALSEQDIRKYYRMTETELGRGTFGLVKTCVHRNTGEVCAVKIVEKSKPASGINIRAMIMGEISALEALRHPNILRYYEFFEDSDFFYAVSELCSGGELFSAIKTRRRFSEQDASQIAGQVFRAIAHCHFNGIVHRDIKAENFLFRTKEDNSEVVLIDFGFATPVAEGEMLTQVCGSPRYVAPEVLLRSYNKPADVWSVGVVLYLLIFTKHPFGPTKVPMKQIIEEVKTKEICWDELEATAESIDLLKRLLDKNPQNRLTASEALQHPWISTPSDAKRESIINLDEGGLSYLTYRTAKPTSHKIYSKRLTKLNSLQSKYEKGLSTGGRRLSLVGGGHADQVPRR
eukprot:GHVS01095464.1.p1 GENE.GHVS01095464.1~~GHVS01095464.1.p1  ORF type:complete len:365 (-),score=41.65 GHVS01095464.1:339-1433(-)